MKHRVLYGTLVSALFLFLSGAYVALAAEQKEVTVTGEVVCGHCTLKAVKECAPAIKAQDASYLLTKNEESDKLFDKRDKGVTVTVTGVLEEKDGQKWITASKVEVKEKQ